jgi:hypothetical protein
MIHTSQEKILKARIFGCPKTQVVTEQFGCRPWAASSSLSWQSRCEWSPCGGGGDLQLQALSVWLERKLDVIEKI